jgi:predicted O-methyltransferase YrrM
LSVLGDLYRAVAAPFGARAVERMLREGLPPRLAGPLRALFRRDAGDARIERMRNELASRGDRYRFIPSENALGPVRWAERDDSGVVTSAFLANNASVSPRWGSFLRDCAEAFEAKTVLELGACVGISGAYLASAKSHPRLVTIDASSALATIAEATLAAVTERAEVVRGTFEAMLPSALDRLGEVDLAYIDGHHDELATLHYVRTVAPRLSSEALVVLDDITLYPEMWRAWQTLSAMPGVAAAVNVGRFGLLVWRGGDAQPRQFDLSRWTGRWRVGRPREVHFDR